MTKSRKIYNLFYILGLRQNISKNEQIDKNVIKFGISCDNKKYKFEIIGDNIVYTIKSAKY